MTIDPFADVSKAIQLALGPVFLLTGIAGMLNVMTNRLTRIIDRGRMLTDRCLESAGTPSAAQVRELATLEQRRHFTSLAITACTVSALLVCLVIASLFVEALFDAPLKWLVGALFTASTGALIVGLAYFLREVHLATQTIRIPAPEIKP